MATIKAGTYRWNDVLTHPPYDDGGQTISANFTVSTVIDSATAQAIKNQIEAEGTQADFVIQDYSFVCAYSALRVYVHNDENYKYFILSYENPNVSIEPYDPVVEQLAPALLFGGLEAYHSQFEWGHPWYQTITITNDTDVSNEFYEWFTANTVEQKTIKAGTYRFKDVLTNEYPRGEHYLNFTVSSYVAQLGTDVTADCFKINMLSDAGDIAFYFNTTVPDLSSYGMTYPHFFWVYDPKNGWSIDAYSDNIQTIIVPYDQDVSAEFAEWFTANTKRLSTITYNGSIIATLNGGQTATLKCAGMKMESDVVVDVAEIPESSDTRIIEVNELPTENIDENALYKVGDTYHRYGGELLDVLWVWYDGLQVGSFVDAIKANGTTVELFYAKTKSTENIKETDDSIYNVYYIEDEDNIFVYTNGMWLTVSTALEGMGSYTPYFKTVRSIDDIGETDEYIGVLCALIYTGWKDYPWTNGTLTVEEVGTHNVTDKKEVNVNLGAVAGVWKFEQYGVYENDNISSWKKFQPVNFTTTINGEVVYCIGIERYDDKKSGGCTMRYKLSDGSYYNAWALLGSPEWGDEGCKTIDFGTEPQFVSGEFKQEFVAKATRIETPLNLQEKTVTLTETGTFEITADAGFNGLQKIIIKVNVTADDGDDDTGGDTGGGDSGNTADYTVSVGDYFGIAYEGNSPAVECPSCLEYRDDGGELVFTGVSVGSGTIKLIRSSEVYAEYTVEVV